MVANNFQCAHNNPPETTIPCALVITWPCNSFPIPPRNAFPIPIPAVGLPREGEKSISYVQGCDGRVGKLFPTFRTVVSVFYHCRGTQHLTQQQVGQQRCCQPAGGKLRFIVMFSPPSTNCWVSFFSLQEKKKPTTVTSC